MIDADIIICTVSEGQVCHQVYASSERQVLSAQGEVRDSWSTSFADPGRDEASGGTADVTLHAFSEHDGMTEVHISRRLDTGDAFDRVINEGEPTDIIFAWGTDDVVAYHGVANRGKSSMTVRLSLQELLECMQCVPGQFRL